MKELQLCGFFGARDMGIREYSVQKAMIKTVLYCTQKGGDLDGMGVSGVGVC